MNDYGLLPALPVVFFVALALLVGSTVALLLRTELSPVRLGLHLVALVVMLHGTSPLLFRDPIYPWVYKHVGVVGYINLHGKVDAGVDIYHNWPGFFALAAWFTRIAGVASPLDFAAWAPLYFNLLICVELGFVFRSLPVTQRVRWLGLFLFAAANWIGQDYFSPQALAFVLSLAVFGMVLAWLQVDRPPAVVAVARRMISRLAHSRSEATEPEGAPRLPGPRCVLAVGTVFVVFAVVVITHQLSPYVVLLGLGLLTLVGMVRPRWVVGGLAAMAIAYLVLRLPYVERTQDLFSSVGDPLSNLHNSKSDGSVVMPGRRLTALAAPALFACLWTLGLIGIVRRVRAGRPTLVLALLAFSPTLLALGQSYGGEAIFRIYLFSLPWIALLGASALEPRALRRPLWSAITVGVVLSATVVMFMAAFFGAEELYVVRPGELQASQYYYDHAEPGGDLTLVGPNFPARVGDRYDKFGLRGDNERALLNESTPFRHRVLGATDLPAVAQFVEQRSGVGNASHYLALSTGQQVFAEVQGLLPPGSVAGLDSALAQSPDWQVFYRNADAVIYRMVADGAGRPAGDEPGAGIERPPLARSSDRSVDLIGLGAGLFGLGALGLVLHRRVRTTRFTDLGQAPDPAAVGAESNILALVGALDDPDPEVRRRAVEALVQQPSAGLARCLVEELTPSTVDSVGEVLLGIGSPGAQALLAAVVTGRREQSEAAIDLLRGSGASSRPLIDLGALDPALRFRAVEVLGALGGPDAVHGFVVALRDPRPEIRVRAALHLGRTADEGGRRAIEAVAESDQVPEVRKAANTALRAMERSRKGGVSATWEA